MRIPQLIAIWLLLCQFACAQTIVVESFEAITAKSVKTLELPDAVAVILTERQPGVRTGAFIQVTSDRKWATPVYDGIEIKETAQPGQWLMWAPPGKYRILLAESDPEIRPRYTFHDVVIKVGTEPPPDTDDPTDPPPTGDFAALTKATKDAADRLNDPKTRAALASAYKGTLSLIQGKTYAEATDTVQKARRMVLLIHMKGNPADWDSWRTAVDVELGKVVPAGDAAKYVQAIAAIVKGLE